MQNSHLSFTFCYFNPPSLTFVILILSISIILNSIFHLISVKLHCYCIVALYFDPPLLSLEPTFDFDSPNHLPNCHHCLKNSCYSPSNSLCCYFSLKFQSGSFNPPPLIAAIIEFCCPPLIREIRVFDIALCKTHMSFPFVTRGRDWNNIIVNFYVLDITIIEL